MKSGKQILALTILSLGVYRFSQTFLVQQVQKVSAADTAVGKENSNALTGNELNITVKNYPTKTIESSSNSSSSSSSVQVEQPVSKTQPAQQTTNQSPVTAQRPTNTSDKTAALEVSEQTVQNQAETTELTKTTTSKSANKHAKKAIKKHAKTTKHEQETQQGQGNANQDRHQADFLKHHAQVEKDIAMFQQSMSPNTPSGGATTQVGAIFGALAGQGVYAVQDEIE